MVNVLSWKCKKCDKELTSLYERQFNYNREAHKLTHLEEEKE